MSRLKRFGIGTGITLLAFSAVTGIWYQRHYALPPAPLAKVTLPSPNGFDTLREAVGLRVEKRNGATILEPFGRPIGPLPQRQALLAANKPAILVTRRGLAQDYFPPPLTWPQNHFRTQEQFYRQIRLLVFASRAYAVQGNLPEAMTCALDAIELGSKIPRGGALEGYFLGNSGESLGRRAAWDLVDRVDAKTARAASERLKRIETTRWSLARALEEERRVNCQSIQATFTGGPLPSWAAIDALIDFHNRPPLQVAKTWIEKKSQKSALQQKLERLWLQTRIVYYGPRTVLDSTDSWLQQLQKRAEQPWSNAPYPGKPKDHPFSLIAEPTLAEGNLMQVYAQSRLPLLQTYLALRAEFLETGRYPVAPPLPADPFSPAHAPLGYRTDGKNITLWSVGPDGVDDHGTCDPGNPNMYFPFQKGDLLPRVNTW